MYPAPNRHSDAADMPPTPDRLSDAAYSAVNEVVLKAMFWTGVLVPPGLAQRVTAELVAVVEGDLARQRATALIVCGHD